MDSYFTKIKAKPKAEAKEKAWSRGQRVKGLEQRANGIGTFEYINN